MQLKAHDPQELRIIRRNPNGSGVVRMPILRVAKFENGPYAGSEITAEHLRQAAENFRAWPGPVPVNVSPHRSFADDSNAVPGFIEGMDVAGDTLYADIFLIAELMGEVDAGMWRGFSVDIWDDIPLPTGTLAGKSVSGGVFTNRPAADVNFKIAAGIELDKETPHLGMYLEFRLAAAKEKDMSETKTVAALEVAVNEGTEKVAQLEATLAKEQNLKKSLAAQIDTMASDAAVKDAELSEARKSLGSANIAKANAESRVSQLESEIVDSRAAVKRAEDEKRTLAVKLEAETTRSTAEQVMKLVGDSIDRGVSAALFEGVEADPGAWFNSKFNSIEALQSFVSALPVVKSSAVSSGKPDDQTTDLSTEQQKKLRRLGLDPRFASVSDENEYLDLKLSDADKK